MNAEYYYETIQAMEEFLDHMSFSYTAKLVESEKETGYMMMDFLSHGNHVLLMRLDADKKKLFMDYYPGIEFCDTCNIAGHCLIESINTRINDVSILVTENRQILYRGLIDIDQAPASAEAIRRVYECNIFVTLVFGDILKECLLHPNRNRDYVAAAKESALRITHGFDDDDNDIDCIYAGDPILDDDTRSCFDDDDDYIDLEPDEIL